MQLSKNFYLKEFESDMGVFPTDVLRNLRRLAKELQLLRDELGKPIIINSGYRDLAHNKRVGGATNSYHLRGMAADFYVKDFPIGLIYNRIKKLQAEGKMHRGGLILYRSGNFIHYDIREKEFEKIVP